ncbi:class I SAM-dependent methyltransferase [Ferruginibacter sp. SUN106]|uniref:class I SAM-dependent methyltransferase n=1 Tax=Ferruginibacter sp. SUN106 TaxID=2978348 RepID=UPI003D35BCB8
MIHYTNCPVCSSQNIAPALTAKDYTVSQKEFAVWHCNACTARFTQDVPEQNAIGPYYQSDNYISHSDTKKGFVNTLYHAVRKRTLDKKKALIIGQVGMTKGEILDIGCGTGAFLNTMKTAGWGITGLEPDDTARKKAAELYSINPQSPEQLFQLKPASYHAITMWHVLEHVHELHAYIKQLAELITPQGKIFIAVPNYTSKDADIYKEFWAAYDVPRHLYHFSPASMKVLLSTYNLKLTTIRPMWYDSFYVSMLSEQYKNGKGNIIKAFWNGLISNLKAMGDKTKCSSVIYVISK